MKNITRFLTGLAAIIMTAAALSSPATAQTPVYWDGTSDQSWYGDGSADEFVLMDGQDLAGLAGLVNAGNDFSGKTVKLGADIYLSDNAAEAADKPAWTPIGGVFIDDSEGAWEYKFDTLYFCGTFDGQDYTIYNVYNNSLPDQSGFDDPFGSGEIDFTGWYKGFFGYLKNATVQNLDFENMEIVGAATIGGLATFAENSLIENCSVSGLVSSASDDTGGMAGGLVAEAKEGTVIENCQSSAFARAPRGAGSIAGYNSGTIRNSSATGGAHCSQYFAGGFVGVNTENGVIENCSSSGTVSRDAYQSATLVDCAGFVGRNAGLVKECSSSATIESRQAGAGFCGSNNGRLESCVSSGDVMTASNTAAVFVGNNGWYSSTYDEHNEGTAINCFGYGKCVNTGPESDPYGYLHSFLADYDSEVSTDPVDGSRTVNCYADADKFPYGTRSMPGSKGGAFRRGTADMQSQAFVDTLNMMAAVSGTSAWEYRAGDYPVPTGQKADISDWLAGGSGTKDDPFRVETEEQLKHIADMVNHGWDFRGQYIRLDADIDLNPPFEEWGTTMPVQWMPIGRFTSEESPNGSTEYTYFFRGTFDGNFHGINNMYINNSMTDGYQGLFGALSNNATIKNLSINDVWIYGHGAIGIVTGYIHRFGSGILISQVNTSGTVESNWGAGGISGSVPLEGNFKVLNSCSSANLKAVTYARPVGADQNYVDTQPGDTIANFFYTGNLEGQSSRNQGTFGKEPSINCYFDSTVFHWTDEYARSTEYMQSKEFVNELNYFVAKYNARTGVEPLSYWQWNDGGYPTWTDEVPPHTVYYNSHGGTVIAPQPALDDSRVLPPDTPEADGLVFGGWFKDESLTEAFDFDTTPVTGDITLHAKWHEEVVPDFSPFDNPFATSYVIKTREQLLAFSLVVNGVEGERDPDNLAGKTVSLGNDIVWCDTLAWKYWGDFAYGLTWIPIGNGGTHFEGTFDGGGHTVSGIYVDSKEEFQGFFGYIGPDASVKNVGIKASFVRGNENTGGLAGINRGAIDNCFAIANVECYDKTNKAPASYAGVLVGRNAGIYGGERGGTINNSYAKGSVTGASNIGGLAGVLSTPNSTDVVSNCRADVDVTGWGNVGGLIGHLTAAEISNCHASGNVSNNNQSRSFGEYTGGLIGNSEAVIRDCHASGDVNCSGIDCAYIGGLAGSGKNIYDSHASGNVNGGTQGSYTGGLAGEAEEVSGCYATGDVQGGDYVGGLVGYGNGNISDSHYQGSVKGLGKVAGIVGGFSYRGYKVSRCHAIGKVEASNSYAAGIVASEYDKRAMISECFMSGEVTSAGDYAAGIAASASSLTDCYAIATVSGGQNYVGGLVAYGYQTTITNSYAACEIAGGSNPDAYIGAVTGDSRYTTTTSTYYDSGTCSVSDGKATAKTTAEMQMKRTFEGWDFNEVWGRNNDINNGYPYLRFTYDEQIPDDEDPAIPVSGITVNPQDAVLEIGKTMQLEYVLEPADATNQNITWSSSGEEFATVSQSGLVTALSEGETVITVRTEDGGFEASCTIEVIPQKVPVTGVELDIEEETITVGSTLQLTATVLPGNSTDKNVRWSSSRTNIAIVDENGLVTAVGSSHAQSRSYSDITVTTEDGGYTATCRIYTREKVNVASIVLYVFENGSYLHYTDPVQLSIGDTRQLVGKVYPEDADNTAVTWHSSDENVVTVSEDGLLTATGNGSATVKVTSVDGGASDITDFIVVGGEPVSVNETDKGGASLSPNPASSVLHIECDDEILHADIVGTSGAIELSQQPQNGDLDVSPLSPGMYILYITTANGTVVEKFIKK